jgi:hypothetical protein
MNWGSRDGEYRDSSFCSTAYPTVCVPEKSAATILNEEDGGFRFLQKFIQYVSARTDGVTSALWDCVT